MAATTAEIYSECLTKEFRRRTRRRPVIAFDGRREFADSVRDLDIRASPSFVQTGLSAIPAFGMWADRPETDDELLEALGGQWALLDDGDALSD